MERETITIDFEVPRGWHELTDGQLTFLYSLIAAGMTGEEIAVTCLLRWSGTSVVGRQPGGAYLLKQGERLFEVGATAIAEVASDLGWLTDLPPYPARISRLGNAEGIAADFQGVPFETYIICDNLYQGLLAQGLDGLSGLSGLKDGLLAELAKQLYPGINLKPSTLNHVDEVNIFYWMASLKMFFARRFRDFFQAPEDMADSGRLGPTDIGTKLQEAMDAQIRALTKGDITKEAEILALDTWRALTELNAQAREYRQLQAMTKK